MVSCTSTSPAKCAQSAVAIFARVSRLPQEDGTVRTELAIGGLCELHLQIAEKPIVRLRPGEVIVLAIASADGCSTTTYVVS
jgi:hypothetical protein